MFMAAFAKPLLCAGRFISTKFNLRTMSVEELIRALEKMPKDKIVVLTEPDGIGWDNIGQVIEDGSTVKITMDGNHPFED
jgi:hypothetical protein